MRKFESDDVKGWVNALRSLVPAPPPPEQKKTRSNSLLHRRSSMSGGHQAPLRNLPPQPNVARLPPDRSISCRLSDASISVAEVYDVDGSPQCPAFALTVSTPRHLLKTTRTLEQTLAFIRTVGESVGELCAEGSGDAGDATDTGEGVLGDLRIKALVASQVRMGEERSDKLRRCSCVLDIAIDTDGVFFDAGGR